MAATRLRLLDAAGDAFAAVGFRAATVRDICRRAGANVAAINYHFGDKERLYAEVLRHAHAAALDRYPPDLGLAPDAGPRERLDAFVRSFLLRCRGEGRPAWHGRLMAREMADPTVALDGLVRESIRPLFERLTGIVRELLGARANDDEVALCAASVVGQCLFWFFADPVIARLPTLRSFRGPEALGRLGDHVAAFSRAALCAPVPRRGAARRKERAPP